MIKEVRDIIVSVEIGDLCNYLERIKKAVDQLRFTASGNGIISDVESYDYIQQPYSFSSLEPKCIFNVRCVCLCRKYFPRDIILLKISLKDRFITAGNEFFTGTMPLTDASNHLSVNDLGVFLIDRVREFNGRMIGNLHLYTPNPIVYKITFDGERSQSFIKSIEAVHDLARDLASNTHYKDVVDHLFMTIDGVKLNDFNRGELYLHYNSIEPIAIYSSVNSVGVSEMKLTSDSDHTIAEMLRNKMLCISNILDNYTMYVKTIDAMSDVFASIREVIDEI